jgi:Skp family chaperone for outer membrane proteins
MKKMPAVLSLLIAVCFAFPSDALAMKFGTIDAAKLFSKYSETQKTKSYLESEKTKLQKELDTRKKTVADLDGKYVETAKKLQALRDGKKEAEAKALEGQLKTQREALANASSELEKFFQESQKRLYEIEEQKMGDLSKNLDTKVDQVIQKVATSKGFEAVFEKRFCYFGGEDITEEVIGILNVGSAQVPASTPAAPARNKKPK